MAVNIHVPKILLSVLFSCAENSCSLPELKRLQFSESFLMLWYVTFSPDLCGAMKSTAVP